jgi:hypothetical protein
VGLEPTISDVIRGAIEAFLAEVHTLKVGRVEKYDNTQQVANIKIVMRRPFNIGADEVDHEEIPLLYNVPVLWPRAGGFIVHLPIQEGDHILVGFTDDDISAWRTSGSESEPNDRRRHSLGSAVAFGLGIGHLTDVLSINPLDLAARLAGMVLGEDGTDRIIAWTDSAITVGRANPLLNRSSFVALADRTEARITALEAAVTTLTASVIALNAAVAAAATVASANATAFGSHTHTSAAPASPTSSPIPASGAMAPTTPPAAPPAPFAANPLPVAADILKGTGPLP